MKNFWTRWAVLLISIIFLSSCGASNSSPSATPETPEGIDAGVISPQSLTPNTSNPPINIWSGHVGNTSTGSKSYYQVSVSANTTYTITLYGLSADADLWVYDYFPFDFITGPVCKSQNGGTANEQCVVKAKSTGMMNIEVDGQYSLSGATYYISVNTAPIVEACSSGPGCFDFDTNPTAFPTPFVLTETGGVAPLPWNLDEITDPFGTANSIHSGGLINSETSCFSYMTTTSTDSYVSFDLSVSSSTVYYDLLLFYIDNVLQLPVWSGPVTQKVMFNTTTGTHTYKWCHTNNSTGVSGDVWVDNISIQ